VLAGHYGPQTIRDGSRNVSRPGCSPPNSHELADVTARTSLTAARQGRADVPAKREIQQILQAATATEVRVQPLCPDRVPGYIAAASLAFRSVPKHYMSWWSSAQSIPQDTSISTHLLAVGELCRTVLAARVTHAP
jgi:hypothetical protein